MRLVRLVLSDLHLGTGAPRGSPNILEDFRHDDELVDLLAFYDARVGSEGELELVLNGDIFDLLKVKVGGVWPAEITDEIATEKLRQCLEGHPKVLRVHHPSLASHPDHAVAQRLFRGVGGVVSFVHAGGLEGARRVCDRARIARIGPSFGGPQTLIEPVALMSYFEQGPEGRAALGIEEGLVRVACGLEETSAIVEDILAALA